MISRRFILKRTIVTPHRKEGCEKAKARGATIVLLFKINFWKLSYQLINKFSIWLLQNFIQMFLLRRGKNQS